MFKFRNGHFWAAILFIGFQFLLSCDSDDPDVVPEPDDIIGLWTFESQELEFYLNGTKLPQQDVEEIYAPIAGIELDDFQIPEGATFEFKEDGTFEGNAEGFDTQTGAWELSEDRQTLKLSSETGLLFLDTENLPELAQDVFFEEDGSIAFEVKTLNATNASFFLSGETQIEFLSLPQTIRVDLTINMTK